MEKKAKYEHIIQPHNESFRCFEVRGPRFDHPYHFHPEIELTLITESAGMRLVGDSLEPFAGGDLCLLGKDLPHIYHNSQEHTAPREARAIVIQFSRSFGGGMLDIAPEFEEIANMLDQASRGLRFPAITVTRVKPKMLGLLYLKGDKRILLFLEILLLLANAHCEHIASASYQPPNEGHRSERIVQACKFIFQNSHEAISQADVAQHIGMSLSAFGRFFQRQTNQTYKQFIDDIRFGHACNLLVQTELPIIEVCHESGFGNLSNFNRRFKLRHQMSPKAFRKIAEDMRNERRFQREAAQLGNQD